MERLSQPNNCPTVLYNVMKKCWEKEPDSRPKFSELLSEIESIKESLIFEVQETNFEKFSDTVNNLQYKK